MRTAWASEPPGTGHHESAGAQGRAAARRSLGRLALAELRRLAGLVEAGLLALDLACVPRAEALALEGHAQFGVRLDESAGDPVPDRTRLPGQAAAVDTDTEVVLSLE